MCNICFCHLYNLFLSHVLSFQHKDHAYRDRAAERRSLHGGFGVGPGQKKSTDDDNTTPVSATPEEAAAEALNMSFGVGSYARRMLENMGWKEVKISGNFIAFS